MDAANITSISQEQVGLHRPAKRSGAVQYPGSSPGLRSGISIIHLCSPLPGVRPRQQITEAAGKMLCDEEYRYVAENGKLLGLQVATQR